MKRILVLIILLWAGAAWAIPPMPSTGDMTKAVYDADGNGVIDGAAVPSATEGTAGISERCTDAEMTTGTKTDCDVTPANAKVELDKKIPTSYLDTDGTMAANSDVKVASQKATKTYADTKLAKASNLSDVANTATARTNLGLAIGTNVQAYHALLASLAGLTTAQGDIVYFTAANTAAALNKGTAGQLLQMNSGATAPEWTSSLSAIFTFGNGATSAGYFYFAEDSTNGTDKTKLIGAETLAADITLTLPATTGTLALTADKLSAFAATTSAELAGVISDETGTGAVVLGTSPTIETPLTTIPVIDGGAADLVLTAAQCKGTVISNTGQGVNDRNHTLPTLASGLNWIGFVGEAQAAKYYRFTAAVAGTICLDGTCGKKYVSIAAPTRGAQVMCHAEQFAETGIKTGAALAIGSTTTAVANGAFTYDAAGAGYAKAADTVGTAPGNDVIPQNKYGAVAFDIGANGTIDVIEATDNATGYDSAALAIAGLAAAEAGHARMGTVTAMKSDGTFTFGTTDLNAANTTVAYTSTTAYTKPYYWNCLKSIGTWVTD